MELNAVAEYDKFDDVFDAVLRWELPDPDAGSSWEWTRGTGETPPITFGVRDRSLVLPTGTLRWNEEIQSFREESEIRFVLVGGDFASFEGAWKIAQHGADVAVRFEVDFDFGVPSMASILDPVAEQAITDTITRALGVMRPQVRMGDATVASGSAA
jgi:hypothetical protein